MAETAVGIVIDKLIPLLRDEVTLLEGVHKQIEGIKDELVLIQAYLKDVNAKAEMADTSNVVKEWVKQLREVAFYVEDVIDLYMLKVAKRHQTRALVPLLSKIRFSIGSVIPRHEITSEIAEIRGSLTRLYEGKNHLGINLNASEASSGGISMRHDLRLGALFIEDDELVGVDDTKELLTDWILNGETKRTVIAVVGQGGLGKTTIVNNVYNKQKEQRSFQCYAWITVSRSLKEEHLLKTIMQKLYEEDNNKIAAKEIGETVMSKEDLIRKIREHLQGRNYMIVFDDVWEQDFWIGVQFALPIHGNGRIIITTRHTGVAEFCKPFAPVYIHELEPLPPEHGLKLFLIKTFQFDSEGCPEELMGLCEAFVDKCEGVPLAIEAIAGLLSTKNKTVSEWKKVYDSLSSKLSNDPHLKSYYQVLSESYHDLPYHLKSCILYFGLFTEDYSIKRMRLIRLWVAEGFIKEEENNDQTKEEAAEEYLGELIRRCLVKVSDSYTDGRVRSCRVHDLMHAFITRKCEELNFCQVLKNEEFRFNRRLSIHKNIGRAGVESSRSNYGQVRSCFVCEVEELPKPLVQSLLSSFKLLVTLDFEDSGLDYLPEPVGMLLNLKYLSLQETKVKLIPMFIGELQNLETLNLKGTQVCALPKEINKLIKLRHLIAYPSDLYHLPQNQQGVKLNEGLGCLTALQSLIKVDATDQDGLIEELKNLKKIRRLGIRLRKINGNQLCSAIKNMTHLCSLSIFAADLQGRGDLELQSLIDPPSYLQRLYLRGRLENLPEWISKLKNLVTLRLMWSALTEDPLPILKCLTELLDLGLSQSYEGVELHFQEGWFPKLKCLHLESLHGLRTLKIDEKALPQLEQLVLGPCPQMVQAPTDIQNLESLKQVFLLGMPSQFEESVYTKLKENIGLYVSDSMGLLIGYRLRKIDENLQVLMQENACAHECTEMNESTFIKSGLVALVVSLLPFSAYFPVSLSPSGDSVSTAAARLFFLIGFASVHINNKMWVMECLKEIFLYKMSSQFVESMEIQLKENIWLYVSDGAAESVLESN
ncbi:hypothetical protein VNO77_29666 [Canavalia gladiata]|uniref:Disease resistance protein RPM1 n=1 Tax=Canavalia gladiata TaxID=3824 RepID=A0AAN9KN57_CANGL